MLSKSRLYIKKEPDRDARLFIIFCEGEKTEPNYFKYFNGIASQIKIELIPHLAGNNSPLGLYEAAKQALVQTEQNPLPKYSVVSGDQVWFVIDTDQWGETITKMREKISQHTNWAVAQSNPCFEVWQYYHLGDTKPDFPDMHISGRWKQFLSTMGGFNCNKHPVYLERAAINARNHTAIEHNSPSLAGTEIYLLAEAILPLVKKELDLALEIIQQGNANA